MKKPLIPRKSFPKKIWFIGGAIELLGLFMFFSSYSIEVLTQFRMFIGLILAIFGFFVAVGARRLR